MLPDSKSCWPLVMLHIKLDVAPIFYNNITRDDFIAGDATVHFGTEGIGTRRAIHRFRAFLRID